MGTAYTASLSHFILARAHYYPLLVNYSTFELRCIKKPLLELLPHCSVKTNKLTSFITASTRHVISEHLHLTQHHVGVLLLAADLYQLAHPVAAESVHGKHIAGVVGSARHSVLRDLNVPVVALATGAAAVPVEDPHVVDVRQTLGYRLPPRVVLALICLAQDLPRTCGVVFPS